LTGVDEFWEYKYTSHAAAGMPFKSTRCDSGMPKMVPAMEASCQGRVNWILA
jgi:hypothetical protein